MNTNWKHLEYVDRACCQIGSDQPSDQCAVIPPDETSLFIPIVVGCGAAFAIAIAVFFFWLHKRRNRSSAKLRYTANLADEHHMPPPTAPPTTMMEAPLDYSESFARVIPPPTDSSFVKEQIHAYHSQTLCQAS
mmetsp:Transcript_13703/g.22672  ORF Transcript_13703/g.22672 Transcript_13703/m.22672 type:complete len:134 (+) Transcript_13703:1569-1970(+)